MNENASDEQKLNSAKSLLVKLKGNYKKACHKLEKIERALLKAENENNKVNEKKCKKYKIKYEQKVAKIRFYIKQTQAKLEKYVEAAKSEVVPTKGDDKQALSKTRKIDT